MKKEIIRKRDSRLPILAKNAGLINGEIIILPEIQNYILENKTNPFGDVEYILSELEKNGYEIKYPSRFEKEMVDPKEEDLRNSVDILYDYIIDVWQKKDNEICYLRRQDLVISSEDRAIWLNFKRLMELLEKIPFLKP